MTTPYPQSVIGEYRRQRSILLLPIPATAPWVAVLFTLHRSWANVAGGAYVMFCIASFVFITLRRNLVLNTIAASLTYTDGQVS